MEKLQWQYNNLEQPIGRKLDWPAAQHPSSVAHSGVFARLTPLSAQTHTQPLYTHWAADKPGVLWTYMPYGPFASATDYSTWIKSVENKTDPLFYCITNTHGEACGIFALDAIKPDKGSIELAHVVFSPAIQATPIATEAVYLALNYVFTLGYRRCEWKCNALNENSKKAALRFGFSYEGLFRNHMVVKNRNRDTTWFGMTSEDWQQLKPAYQTWLNASNFDETGRQKQALSQLTRPVLRQLLDNPLGTNRPEPDL